MSSASKKTVLVLHLAGQIPLAGLAWQALHHVLGLRRLGLDAWYIEDSGASPYNPNARMVVADSTYNVTFVKTMMERFGLGDRWAFWDATTNEVHNISREQLMSLYSNAAGLFNVCGVTQLREEHLKCPVRVYIDTDPGFEQAKLAAHDPKYIENIGAHTHHFTYGQNIGNADCKIPLSNINWYPTWPPVLIDLWATDGAAAEPFFSSIATWENQGKDIEIAGETYRWSKQSNFMKFLDLPRHAPQRFRLALRAPDANVEASLRKCGWELVDPGPLSSDIAPYRDFIVRSRAEFTVAKDIYVRPKTGWFSDRSVCYLAAGRPVIAQETGYSKFIKTGKGLFPFSTMAEIVDACARVNADYAMQAAAARETASAFFRAEAILAQMLETCSL